ncbi:beta-lactamase domain protein [Sulfolobus islandicus Y.G.57.14]|uniref:Transcription termination factor FttA n=3 Tax=Saccharolobus islandicus TaxID=43080 RepID=C3NEA3_SACI7|nr:beta-CASP ribonuclease aCPSF1 [Sulfolobus islandicus]ACP45642.1 beta-lactamase domain protein [Sulfolobus islandicus Y.G.57.14]ACP48556.1 beta-lactamase domain protein [Sulfolobus islandicus Y.N.15.51]ADB87251.1 beta-lactamase domain protein [Sulfolobus islandicus L.D.8.5]PVU78687.1 beta-CASP ribonuclease aCPSF1 [Sulfolobus islandicus]
MNRLASLNRINTISLIYSELKDLGITRIEYEGPTIAVYVKKPTMVTEKGEVIKKIAKDIKKRIIIKADPSVRKDKKEAVEIIKNIVPTEAEIVDIKFDDDLGEVLIKAKKPGLVIGKGGSLQQRIFAETFWKAEIVREPPIRSRTYDSILEHIYNETEYRAKILKVFGERIHRETVFQDKYVRITALGGFLEVGRSAVLVETPESKVLLDVGLNPSANMFGEKLFPRLDIDQLKIEELDAVVITHAHLDHCGMVPFLFKYGYEGPVYTTVPTRDIMALMQLDSLDVVEKEGKPIPYSAKEVRKELLHTITLDYGEVTDIAPDIRLTFYNAGHILGSAMAHLHIGDGKHNIVYTGDFKYAKTKLLDKANTEFPRVDTLIMETTYGAQDQPNREESELELLEIINKTLNRGGKVLIPVLAVGRGQEIMLIINDFMKKKLIPEVPVYVTGLVDEVTAIHNAYPEWLGREVREEILYKDENPFTSEHFKRIEGYKEDIAKGEPSIILATSGMLNGGPAVEFFKTMAPDPKNAIIFVSYQAEGTLGRKVRDGAKEVQILDRDGRVESIQINMEVEAVEGFSGHSDRRQLFNFLRTIEPKPKNIILNHGEASAIKAFANYIRDDRLGYKPFIYTPAILDSLRVA